MEKQKKPLWKRIVKGIIILILIPVLLVAADLAILFITEYKPADEEPISALGTGSEGVAFGQTFQVLTWNIGYCGLGAKEDFFMDGGQRVHPSGKDEVITNLESIEHYLQQEDAEVVFLQEVDQKSTRTRYVDEVASLRSVMDGYSSTFANNFKVFFIPYPIPPLGHMDAGVLTFSKYDIADATRVALPCPFTGIEKIGNLKRCLLVSRVPIQGSDRELVLINLHLEAYDSGEGKIAQTKMLADIMNTEADKGNYVIVGGDFNQVFDWVDDSMYPIVKDGNWVPGRVDTGAFGEGWTFCMDNEVPSCRSLDRPYEAGAATDEFQYYMIDGFIISGNIQVQNVETKDLGFEHSDHNPVEVSLCLSEEQ